MSQPQPPASSANASPPDQTGRRSKPKRRWSIRLLCLLLIVSVLGNFWLYSRYQDYFSETEGPTEKFHSGEPRAADKIAIIRIQGTIMPPFTERVLAAIKQAREDDAVKGVLLTIDSPGGLVADSHQIYHQLKTLREDGGKPVFVAMKRLAASGGYYVAMGAGPEGRLFAEPTTWTGSIGVIIPRYDISGLAKEWKIESDSLKTGKFKDALSPFHKLSDQERELWGGILNESYAKFLSVIDENRPQLTIRKTEEPTAADAPDVVPNYLELVSEQAKDPTNLATGRIFTANVAKEAGLIDEIGFEEDALKQLQEKLGLEEARVVTYYTPVSLWEMVLGLGQAQEPERKQQALFDAVVPQAMYFFSWVPPALPSP